jgi:hypothetical protein
MADKLSELHKCFREKKICEFFAATFALMKWHQRSAWHMAE